MAGMTGGPMTETAVTTGQDKPRLAASELIRKEKYVREKARREDKRKVKETEGDAEKRLDAQLNKYWNKDGQLKSRCGG